MRTYKRIACVKNISNHFNPQINIFKGKLLISATHKHIFSDKVIYFRSTYKQSKPLKKCLSIKYILKHSKNKTTTTTTTLLLLLSRGVGYFMVAVTENGFNVP